MIATPNVAIVVAAPARGGHALRVPAKPVGVRGPMVAPVLCTYTKRHGRYVVKWCGEVKG